ncbi:pilus assembly PilX N-terminal domain-containing protein [Caballeronia sp. LZ062]|uniref:pilus assembly PilX family protein n=1 Tax=unclassified Caballeronia TaxID=2646786 RepID=UPI00285CBD2D|nr:MULTISPECIES: pilus assembly PilX N-terminal domain-containing protein [unclassified Caballeronia]MDR5855327.1 pilus assembly PilX N-terminal domain-containing protein [Caballeronia sp. LZ050]MDR5870144.1 pilus assembly PilX N-terminal domain-containing protein [Caballeronia sp. LZ062]
MKRRALSRGAALPIILLLSAMMLVTASAWLQTSLVAARTAVATRERVQAFHAADSALIRCSHMLSAALPATGPADQEPARWRLKTSFEGASAFAFAPYASWPYAVREPQCLIESWLRSGQPVTSYLVTARGFGATSQTEAWLQLRIDSANGTVTQQWRRVAGKPF